ncbi:GntR family transcriptional regulator [Streptomyces mirabilis]|uniref:GntR family transcriptional regulator n=1 Tax=Streptomyces mirabilis TaxID=68239 RepID=UPI003F4B3EF2
MKVTVACAIPSDAEATAGNEVVTVSTLPDGVVTPDGRDTFTVTPSAAGPAQGPTPLARQSAARIVEHIAASGLTADAHLVERLLAHQLKASRSPIREALRLLADESVMAPAERGGYTVALTGQDLAEAGQAPAAEDGAEDACLRIAADRLMQNPPPEQADGGAAQSMALEGTPGQRLGTYVAEPGSPGHDAVLLLDMTAPGSAGTPHSQPSVPSARER